MYFGACVVFTGPEEFVLLQVMNYLSEPQWLRAGARYQAMFADSDRFTRFKRLTPASLDELASKLRTYEYDSVIVSRDARDVTLAFELTELKQMRCSFELTALCDVPEKESELESEFLSIISATAADYGFIVFEAGEIEAASELNGIPVAPWDNPLSRERRAYFQAIQRAKPFFGEIVRGSAWGTFLSENLAAKLGGLERVIQEAPVAYQVRVGKGVYLRLINEPVQSSDPRYEDAALKFQEFLRPIMRETT